MNKFDFLKILTKKWAVALEICTEGNVIDARVSVAKENGSWEQTNIYCIDQFNEIYDEVKDYKDWYIDFYENIAGANQAEYIDVAFFSTDMPVKKEDDENKVFVWCVLIDQVYDSEQLCNNVRLFAKKEDAEEYARAFIADETRYAEKDEWYIEDNLSKKGEWITYEDRDYVRNHTTLSLFKEEVIQDNE